MQKDFFFTSKEGNQINCSLYGAESFGAQPLVIYAHGFKGFKDWGFVPYAGAFFEKKGMSFLSFNFSHNGIGEDMYTFSELEKFELNTISLEVSELTQVIQQASQTEFFGGYAQKGLGVIGHSRGGGVSIIGTALEKDVQALCTWSSVSSFDRYTKEEKASWKSTGHKEVVNSRTGQVLKMGMPMLKDIEQNAKKSLHILNAIKRLERPLLILHGQHDETVPSFEAEQLNIFSEPAHSKLRLVPQTGHTFGTKHPFEKTNPAFEEVLNLTYSFFREHLG